MGEGLGGGGSKVLACFMWAWLKSGNVYKGFLNYNQKLRPNNFLLFYIWLIFMDIHVYHHHNMMVIY